MSKKYSATIVSLDTTDLEEAGYKASKFSKEKFNLIVECMQDYYESTYSEVLHSCVDEAAFLLGKK